MGRNTLSQQEKELKGTDRVDRPGVMVVVSDKLPITPPGHLTSDAKRMWDIAINQLISSNCDLLVFLPALESFCELYSEVLFYSAQIKKNGYMSAVIKNGQATMEVSQFQRLREKAQKNLLAYATQLGFTPTSVGRMVVGSEPKENDPFDEMLNMDKK